MAEETRKKQNPELTTDHDPHTRGRELFCKSDTREGYVHHYREHITEGVNKKPFYYYDIVRIPPRGSRVTVGRVTAYTTPERLDSLFYRYYHPDHLKPFSFSGTVRFSGQADETTAIHPTLTKHPYLSIPREIVTASDIRVDDEIEITVINSDGWTLTECYHVSQMDDYLIVPLSQFKRAVIQDLPEGKKLVFQASGPYAQDSQKLIDHPQEGRPHFSFKKPIKGPDREPTGEFITVDYVRFINPGDRINIICRPDPEGDGRLDFAYETLLRKARKVARDENIAREFVPKLTRNGWTTD